MSQTWQNRPHTVLSRLALWTLRCLGWTPYLAPNNEGVWPAKVVMVIYPHTSNMDFPIGMLWKWATHAPIRFVAKKELFIFPFGPLMTAFGGLPVNRDRAKGNFVDAVAEIIASEPEIILGVAPEGTRAYTHQWKTGFYYMALKAGVPLALGIIDWKTKRVGLVDYMEASGDIFKDIRLLSQKLRGVEGYTPHHQGPVMVLDRGGNT